MTPTTATQNKDKSLDGFISLLLDEGIVNRDDLSAIKTKYETCEELFGALDALGVISNDELTRVYAKAKSIPYVEIKSIDEQAYDKIDPEAATGFGFIPYSFDESGKILQIAVTDPEKYAKINHSAIKALEEKIGSKIEIFLTGKKTLDLIQVLLGKGEFPRIDLANRQISDEVLQKIPYDLATKYKAIIFNQVSKQEYDVACAKNDKSSIISTLKAVGSKANLKFNIYIADTNQIDRLLGRYEKIVLEKARLARKAREEESKKNVSQKQGNDEKPIGYQPDMTAKAGQNSELGSPGTGGMMTSFENPDLAKIIGKQEVGIEDLKGAVNAGNIPKFVATMLFLAAKERASDVHIEPFEKAIRVRFRIDGDLGDVVMLPPHIDPQIVARVKILSKLKLDESRVPQDGRFEVVVQKQVIDIRVSTLPSVFGEKVVLRLLDKSRKMDKLEDLGIDGLAYDRIIEAISKPYGIILATGPTGSGKSTTLYSVLTRLNKPEVNIVTLEDPVEYEIPGVNQVQVKPQIGFGFADGLRSVLRQDPNIIMVGEIRDGETAELATQAALTGHLVFSTLHTNDAASSLTRIYNLGVEPFLITSSLNAAIGQRLVRRICPKCRVEIDMPQAVTFQVKKELESLNLGTPIKFYKGKGCKECKEGFKGRVGIYEVLEMSEAIEDLVLEKKSTSDIFNMAVKEGMITMKQDGFIKVIKGITTADEVMRVTKEI